MIIALAIISQIKLLHSKCMHNLAKKAVTRVLDGNSISFVMGNSANYYVHADRDYFSESHAFAETERQLIGSTGIVVALVKFPCYR